MGTRETLHPCRNTRFLGSILAVLVSVLLLTASASATETEWTSRSEDGRVAVHLYVYWSLQCPHCLEALPQIEELAAEHSWIRLHALELSRSPENLDRFVAMASALGQQARAVPTLIYCGRMQEGWDPGGQAGFLARLAACRDATTADRTPALESPAIPLFGDLDTSKLSLPVLTVMIAGLDAFNPCAFFVLLFLLSLMVHQRNRRRMLAIGIVFVAISGIMYFAFMAAWLNLFLMIGSLPWVTAGAGALAVLIGAINIKDFIAFRAGVSLSIPESRKTDIFARGRRILAADKLPAMLTATVLLAIAANLYELLCTAGFPMVFTRLLTLHATSTAESYLYLALYNLIYVLPLLAIVVTFALTMGARKLTEREGRLLKLLSGSMMLGLGLLLLAAPEALSSVGITFTLLVIAVAITWLAARMTRRA